MCGGSARASDCNIRVLVSLGVQPYYFVKAPWSGACSWDKIVERKVELDHVTAINENG